MTLQFSKACQPLSLMSSTAARPSSHLMFEIRHEVPLYQHIPRLAT